MGWDDPGGEVLWIRVSAATRAEARTMAADWDGLSDDG